MRRFIWELICFVIGLGACSEILLPEHHNLESLNYSLSEKLSRHPVASVIVAVAWGIVLLLTIRHILRPANSQAQGRDGE